MAQYRKDQHKYTPMNDTLYEVGMQANVTAAENWRIQVARDKVYGVTGLSISGYQAAVNALWIPLWETASAYTYFTEAQQVRVWSSSASDTDVSVKVEGLDANYDPITETVVVTNGSTGVLTTQSFFRINNLSLTRLPMAVGTISAGNSGKTLTLATISIGTSKSAMTIYTVPRGYSFLLEHSLAYTDQSNNQTSMYRSYTKNAAGVITTVLQFPFTGQYESVKSTPRAYPEKTDIQWQFQSTAVSKIGLQVEGLLIANAA